MDISVLDLSNYDPDKDIIMVKVDTGKMPVTRINKHLRRVSDKLSPTFKKHGFNEVLFIPVRKVTSETFTDYELALTDTEDSTTEE